MLQFLPEILERYVAEHTTAPDALLDELATETRRSTEMPQMMVGPVEGALLRLLVRITGARRVLEVGTFTGYSALCMAMALPEGGEIVTCDIDPEATAIARRFWERSGVGSRIRLRLGPAIDTIRSLEGPIDMAFIDADKPGYIDYWEAILPRLRRGGLVVADNVLWDGRVADDASTHDEDTAALAAFNEHVRDDARVEHVMLAVRDGITLAVKVADE